LRNTETEDKPRQRAAISKTTAPAKQAQKGHQKSFFQSMLHSKGVHPFHLSTPDRQSRDVLNLDLMVTFLPAPVESDTQSRTGHQSPARMPAMHCISKAMTAWANPSKNSFTYHIHPRCIFMQNLLISSAGHQQLILQTLYRQRWLIE